MCKRPRCQAAGRDTGLSCAVCTSTSTALHVTGALCPLPLLHRSHQEPGCSQNGGRVDALMLH